MIVWDCALKLECFWYVGTKVMHVSEKSMYLKKSFFFWFLQTRDMPLREFQEKYPEDFKSGALKEIKERYSAMAEAAQQSVPIALANGRKRGAEPVTVLRTVRARRGAMAGNVLQDVNRSISEENQVATQSEFDITNKSETNSKMVQMHAETHGSHPQLGSISEDAEPTVFNAMPLQTPLPFSGAAMALPVTMVAQSRGGRTKAAPAPDAIVISTADGKQWALGKDGLEGIPESHRAEVAEMLQNQFQFLSAALGKTVFQRPGGRATRRR